MESKEIYANLKSHRKTSKAFCGVFAFDKIPHLDKLQHAFKDISEIYIIVNTHPADKPGEHWFAMCIQNNDNNAPNEYFDSYGLKPPREIVSYLNNYLIYSKKELQDKFTTTCGQWCMFYILCKCNGGTFGDIIQHIIENTRKDERDFLVNQKIRSEFSSNPEVVDMSFISDQLKTHNKK